MNKILRVILLSLMAVVLVSSSAMAAASVTITSKNMSGKWGAFTSSDNTLVISQDGTYSFSGFATISIDQVTLKSNALTAVTINVPKPTKTGSIGTAGKWSIDFPAAPTKRVKLTLAGTATASTAIVFSEAISWTVPRSADLVINAPIRADDSSSKSLELSLTVQDGGTAEFGANAAIYALNSIKGTPTGYVATSSQSAGTNSYTVNAGGELTIRNQYALRGSKLSITTNDGTGSVAKKPATLNINLASGTSLNFAGQIATTGTANNMYESTGTTLNLGSAINFVNNTTIAPVLYSNKFYGTFSGSSFRKTGTSTVTLSQQALPSTVTSIVVEKGSLVFSGQQTLTNNNTLSTWSPTSAATVLVSKDASINVSSRAIEQSAQITFDVRGTATFANRAVVRKGTGSPAAFDEIYPGETYSTTAKTLKINTLDTVLSMDRNSAVNITGFFAAKKLTGRGTITLTGSSTEDAALILTDPEAENYTKYRGKITGTNANIGLYVSSDSAEAYDAKFLNSADVTVKNLIVYGPAALNIDANTDLDGVSSVWLRSNRPGATGISTLKVGRLYFLGGSKASDIELDSIKIDATASKDYIPSLTISGDSPSLDVYLSSVVLYANRSDFTNSRYTNPTGPIYALELDGTAQPSRFIINGVTGDSTTAEGSEAYQVQITNGSDVKFTGSGEFDVLGKNNNLLVSTDAKLEILKGGTIQGNVRFGGSSSTSTSLPTEYAFVNNDGWHGKSLDTYGTFTTNVGSENRSDNNNSDYAVKVTGSVEADKTVLVRVKSDSSAFTGYDSSALDLSFKVLGSSGSFKMNAKPTSDSIFELVSPDNNKGILAQTNKELAVVELGDWSFISGGSDFGKGFGSEFEIKIPFTVTVRGVEATFTKENSKSYFVVSNKKYEFEATPLFLSYEDSEALSLSEIITLYGKNQTLDSSDIYATIDFNFDGTEPYIKVSGTSYSGTNPVTVDIALYVELQDKSTSSPETLPGFKVCQFIRTGSDYGAQYSNAALTPTSALDVDYGASGNVSFTVSGLYKVTSTTSSMPVLVNGVYTWPMNTATTETWYMPDASGSSVKVSEPEVLLYSDGSTTPTTLGSTNYTITSSGTNSTITVPISALGTTNNMLSVTKQLSVKATRTVGVGTLETHPTTFTLHSAVSSANTIALTSQLSKTVARNGDAITATYTIPSSELASPVSYISYGDMPSWLGFSSNTTGFGYTTGDLSNVATGTYDFKILAYSGTNSTSSAYKLYTFTITVENALTLAVSPTTVSMDLSETASVRMTPTYNTGTMRYTVSISPSTGLTAAISGDTITFSATATGTYDATITGTDTGRTANNTKTAAVRVSVGDKRGVFSISIPATLSITLPNTGTLPITLTNNVDRVTYTADQTWVTFSGDNAVFAPTSAGSFTVKITARDTGRTDNNTSEATVSVTVAPKPADPEPEALTLTAGSSSVAITLPETSTLTLTPGHAVGTVSYTANYDWVTFDGNVATFTPTTAGTYDITITATDSTTRKTAQVSVKVTVAAAPDDKPESPDVKPESPDVKPDSPDVKPDSPDVKPDSPDVKPDSPDIKPDSPDVKPESPDISPDIPVNTFSISAARSTVTLAAGSTASLTFTSRNALSTVVYEADVSWIVFAGNVATISAPSATGSYNVIITATDSGRSANSTASTDITVIVTDAGGTTSPDVRPESPDIRPDNPTTDSSTGHVTTPTLNLQDTETLDAIADLISEMFGVDLEDTGISALPTSAVGATRTSSDLTTQERAAIPNTEELAKVFPDVRVAQSGAYYFGVSFNGIPAGTRIHLRLVSKGSTNGAMLHSAAASSELCALVDANGNEVTTVPSDGRTVNAVAYMEAGTEYSLLMTEDKASAGMGSSGGGCDSGFSFLALAVLGMFMKKRVK